MNESMSVERRIGNVVGVVLYSIGAGILLVMALNAVMLVVYPQPSYPMAGFPRISIEAKCVQEGGTWQGGSDYEGYCLTKAEQEHQEQVARSTFVWRVSSVAAGALALLLAFWLTPAGLLVRFSLATGGVMILSGVSGVHLFFMNFLGQPGAFAPPFPSSNSTSVAIGEAVVFLGAWLAVLFAGYSFHRRKSSSTA